MYTFEQPGQTGTPLPKNMMMGIGDAFKSNRKPYEQHYLHVLFWQARHNY